VKSFQEPTEVVVAAGERFEIVLEGNFTTGYRWELDQGDDALRPVSEELRPGGDAPGSAGTQHFEVDAGPKGSYSLRFVYRRPWEGSAQRRRKVTVRVT